MPINSAMTIAGIGNTLATTGAPSTASTAINADSATPGRTLPSHAAACEAPALGAGRVVIGGTRISGWSGRAERSLWHHGGPG